MSYIRGACLIFLLIGMNDIQNFKPICLSITFKNSYALNPMEPFTVSALIYLSHCSLQICFANNL